MSELTVNETRTPPAVVAAIIAVSVVASLFICWLVYIHPPIDAQGTTLAFLPALNALLNGFCTLALVNGLRCILAKNIAGHRAMMFTAFVFSSMFLAFYLANFALHGEMKFGNHGAIGWIYYPLLISHIFLAAVALPMILITFFLSLSERFPAHKKLARWTFPIWLYVSITGVVVYLMLAAYR